MPRFNIGVDCDGVLADFTQGFRSLSKRMFNKPDDSVVQTEWGFGSVGISEIEESAVWEVIRATTDWWLTLERMPDTLLLPRLCQEHNVSFVTSRVRTAGHSVREQTAMWLQKRFGIAGAKVVISHEKGQAATKLALQYMIDDKPSNLDSVIAAVPTCRTILSNMPYNQECIAHPRVDHFDDFASLLLYTGEINVTKA